MRIHLEGLDNCYKSSCALALQAYFDEHNVDSLLFHSGKPNILINEANVINYQNRQYDTLQKLTHKCKMPVIFDRSWVGENVYGKLYRSRGVEYYNKKWLSKRDIYFIFIDEYESAMLREDGKSPHAKNKELFELERELFLNAYNKLKGEETVGHVDLLNVGELKPEDIINYVINATIVYRNYLYV